VAYDRLGIYVQVPFWQTIVSLIFCQLPLGWCLRGRVAFLPGLYRPSLQRRHDEAARQVLEALPEISLAVRSESVVERAAGPRAGILRALAAIPARYELVVSVAGIWQRARGPAAHAAKTAVSLTECHNLVFLRARHGSGPGCMTRPRPRHRSPGALQDIRTRLGEGTGSYLG